MGVSIKAGPVNPIQSNPYLQNSLRQSFRFSDQIMKPLLPIILLLALVAPAKACYSEAYTGSTPLDSCDRVAQLYLDWKRNEDSWSNGMYKGFVLGSAGNERYNILGHYNQDEILTLVGLFAERDVRNGHQSSDCIDDALQELSQ